MDASAGPDEPPLPLLELPPQTPEPPPAAPPPAATSRPGGYYDYIPLEPLPRDEQENRPG